MRETLCETKGNQMVGRVVGWFAEYSVKTRFNTTKEANRGTERGRDNSKQKTVESAKHDAKEDQEVGATEKQKQSEVLSGDGTMPFQKDQNSKKKRKKRTASC